MLHIVQLNEPPHPQYKRKARHVLSSFSAVIKHKQNIILRFHF